MIHNTLEFRTLMVSPGYHSSACTISLSRIERKIVCILGSERN